jgi:predicted esterase
LHKNLNTRTNGTGANQYFIYEPDNPVPATAPVIAFLHGFTDIDPASYQPWIEHLVKRGNLVIFPVYQAGRFDTNGGKFTENSLRAIKEGLDDQQKNGKVQPDIAKFMLVGYSAGGIIATNLAAGASKNGLPEPVALFGVTPGGCNNCNAFGIGGFPLDLENLPALSPRTKVLMLVGDRDVVVGNQAAKFILERLNQIPESNRDFITVQSDYYGTPRLSADHGMANRRVPDALNFYAIWKLTDALQSCAINNEFCEYALGGQPSQRFMGKWSDGTPVKELVVTKKP